MRNRFGLSLKHGLLFATALAVLVTGVSGSDRASAQNVNFSVETLHYHMGLEPDPNQLLDQSVSLNHGNLHNFLDPIAAYGVEDSGISSFVSFIGEQHVWTENLIAAPSEFQVEIEFRTVEPGGKLFGFEDQPIGPGTLSDRLLYIASDGRLHFSGASGISITVPSIAPVTDGEWHTAVARTSFFSSMALYELFIDGVLQGQAEGRSVSSYPGHWRIGNGNITGYPDAIQVGFIGDVRHVTVFEPAEEFIEPEPPTSPPALPPDQPTDQPTDVIDPAPLPVPTEIPFFEPDSDFESHFDEQFIRRGPYVDVSSDIEGDRLQLEISIGNVDLFDKTVWVVREEDGEEFLVGPITSTMGWEGEPKTSRYRVDVRDDFFGELEQPRIVASGSVPVFHQPASAAQVTTAIAATVAIAGAASVVTAATAASASGSTSSGGTWVYELIWRFMRISLAERLRRRTKKLDVSSIPSWTAAITAMFLMAILIAVGRPGALGLNNILVALSVSIPAVILFRIVTIAGGYGLAYYTHQKPRYLIWAAGTVSFAITSIVLQSPIGYTGYMERDPSTRERDARFATAGFAAILSLTGIFVVIGLLTKMSFAETGVTLTLGAVAVSMLPFPFMGGHNIWKWNRITGVASGLFGMIPYILFQLGYISPSGIVALATVGMLTFAAFLVGELWLSEQTRMREALAASKATAEGSSAV